MVGYMIAMYYEKPLKECSLKEVMDGIVALSDIGKAFDSFNYRDDGDYYTIRITHSARTINYSNSTKILFETFFEAYGVKTQTEMSENSIFIQVPKKIPNQRATDWRLHMGDCIYDYSKGFNPSIRKSIHKEGNRKRDLSGFNALLSDNFYYFGEKAKLLPADLKQLIKRNQGHIKIKNADLIFKFEAWIKQFDKNIIYADPQMRSEFDRQATDNIMSKCAKQEFDEDEDETEETIC